MKRNDVYVLRPASMLGFHVYLESNLPNLAPLSYCMDKFTRFLDKYKTKYIHDSSIGHYLYGHLMYGYPIEDTYAFFLKFILAEMTHQNIMQMDDVNKSKMKQLLKPILPLLRQQYMNMVEEFQLIWSQFLNNKCVEKAIIRLKQESMTFKELMHLRFKNGNFDFIDLPKTNQNHKRQ